MSGWKFEATPVSSGGCVTAAGKRRKNGVSPLGRSAIVLLTATFVLGACQTRLPNPLSRAPRGEVQTGDLPPLPAADGTQAGQPFDPNAPAPVATQQAGQAAGSAPFDPAAAAAAAPVQPQTQQFGQAAPAALAPAAPAAAQTLQPAVPAVQLSRADMLGAWQLASAADNCQLFMTLTTWTGGYRATTKGCSSVELANITAWDLSNNQVVLVGATGSQVANLTPAGGNRFSGQTKSGAPVSVSR
ncbi:MAG: AprI/Inh family metalloprotease inhibitor [Hyphomicrobiales bacterium]